MITGILRVGVYADGVKWVEFEDDEEYLYRSINFDGSITDHYMRNWRICQEDLKKRIKNGILYNQSVDWEIRAMDILAQI